ncbi:hypothetical protein [Phenylobacterium sp.]|uniref:hypothetical protein n=1 Tax=Phenylobacterium sp. TaxID=1871053 RepID=UPI00378499B2
MEEDASLTEFETYLRAWDRGHSDVTAKSVQNARAGYRRVRLQTVSDYTLRYEARQR